jgi:putative transcriptional regulator
MSDNLAGMLLVAVPHMLDPNFARSVVLVCDHTESGALGLIINRPSRAMVADYLPGWTHLVVEPGVVFEGGPVQRDVAIGLAGLAADHQAPEGFAAIAMGLGLFDLDSDPAEAFSLEGLRVFSGYAGWEPGQLEAEIAEGGWFVVPLQPGDGLVENPARLWSSVLARQGGRLAVYATFPPNPGLN